MSVAEGTRETLAAKFEAIFPHLDERQRRLVMGAEARALGHGGDASGARETATGSVPWPARHTSTPKTRNTCVACSLAGGLPPGRSGRIAPS
jgi:hypothetical protein